MLSTKQIRTINAVLKTDDNIDKAWVFGSFARNEETIHSDIDILFTFKEGKSFGFMQMARLVNALEEKLKRKVDLVKEDTLLPFTIDSIKQDRILIYGAQN